MGRKISSRNETPDVMPRFQRQSRLDKPLHGVIGRDNAEVIKGASKIAKSPAGPRCHLDGPASGLGAARSGENLGTGGDSLRDAAASIPSGARAARVNWSGLK